MSWVINSTLDEELMSKMHTNSYRDELGGGKAVRKKIMSLSPKGQKAQMVSKNVLLCYILYKKNGEKKIIKKDRLGFKGESKGIGFSLDKAAR